MPALKLEIRLATRADLGPLMALYKLLELPAEQAPSAEEAGAKFDQLTADPRYRIHVAVAGGQIVGTFALTMIGGLTHGARDSCIVEDVVVSADHQRDGIGKQMMQFAIDECARADCYKLVLSSHLQRDKAHAFYEGLGFRKHGYSFLIEPTGAGRSA